MKKFNKNTKKGFTLLEMMLAIAIILLISGLFLGLILAVHESFYRVYNDDDSTDYAALYSQALENQILYDIQNNVSRSYYVNSDYILVTNSGDTFGFGDIFNFNKNKDGLVKWRIYLEAEYEPSSHVLNYTIYVVDNYFHPEQNKLVQQYSSSLWIPYHDEFQSSSSMPNVSVQPYGAPVTVNSFDMTRTIPITPSQIVFTAS